MAFWEQDQVRKDQGPDPSLFIFLGINNHISFTEIKNLISTYLT